MTPFQENQQNKICEISTNRLWKPWKISELGKNALLIHEGIILNPYLDTKEHATVGVGHLIHKGNFVMNEEKLTKVLDYLDKNKIIKTKETIQNNLKQVLNLSNDDLVNAKAEMEYVNSLTESQAISLYDKNIKSHSVNVPEINVPLHQYEYDTLVGLCFNGGASVLRDEAGGKMRSKITSTLNNGNYLQIPLRIDGYGFSRKDEFKSMWNGIYPDKKYLVKDTGIGQSYIWTPLNKR